QVLGPVVLHQEEQGIPVRRPPEEIGVPIESGRWDLRSAARRGNDRDLAPRVVDQLEWPALQGGDLLPLRAPGRRALPVSFRVGPFEGGQLPRRGAGSRVHYVDIVVVVPLPVFRSFADECDRLPVGRPRWQRFIVIARGELGSYPR